MKTLFAIPYASTAQEHKQLALLAPPIANSPYTFFSVAAVCEMGLQRSSQPLYVAMLKNRGIVSM